MFENLVEFFLQVIVRRTARIDISAYSDALRFRIARPSGSGLPFANATKLDSTVFLSLISRAP